MGNALTRLPALLSLVLLGACISTNYVLLGGTGTHPAIHPNEVRIFLTEADVKAPFEKVALVTARGAASWQDEADLIRAMRRRAATLGADGLILGEIEEPGVVERIAGVVLDYEPKRTGRAVAIRIRDDGERDR